MTPTAAEVIAGALVDAGFAWPWDDGVPLEMAIQQLLDERKIAVGDRLWVDDGGDGLGSARPTIGGTGERVRTQGVDEMANRGSDRVVGQTPASIVECVARALCKPCKEKSHEWHAHLPYARLAVGAMMPWVEKWQPSGGA